MPDEPNKPEQPPRAERPARAERRRVGLLIPSSNTVMEPDFWDAFPAGVTVHTGRMFMEDVTPQAEGRMLDEYALPAARDVTTARPEVVVFGCTSAGALRGNAYDGEFCARISRATGVATVSVIASVRAAIAATGARRVGVATPYGDELNSKIRQSLVDDGLEVVKIAGLGIVENVKIAEVPPEMIADFVTEQLAGLDIDLAFVSCTNFRAVEAIPELERRLARPVVTSNQAALDAVRAALDPPGRPGAASGPAVASGSGDARW